MGTTDPVMVGVDGSKASVRAALWAADEAAARDTRLDLVYVVDPARNDDLDDAMGAARHALHTAWQAVTDSGAAVKLESEILQGDPAVELANAARHASLLCVGHKGADDSATSRRGATAEALLTSSPSSVAVVRRRHRRAPAFHRWIIAIIDESTESHAVLQAALDEAELRQAPVLALTSWSTNVEHESPEGPPAVGLRAKMERYLQDTLDDTADIQVCALPMPHDITTVIEQSATIDQLLVVGAGRGDVIAQLAGRRVRDALRKTNCSLLVVR